MRLRENIKPPLRYSGNAWVPPSSAPRIPICARPSNKPPFVDYNPNLPPAVFPTLDVPRPSVDHAQQGKPAEGDGEQRKEGSGNGIRASGDEMLWEPTRPQNTDNTGSENGVNEEDALMHNLRVSGEVIPFQRTNSGTPVAEVKPLQPTQPAEATEEEVVDEEFIRSCQDDPNDYTQIPTWSELSARMQVEIIHNLEKSLGWTEIVSALRLTHHDERSVLAHCSYRNLQIETENRIIRDMHEEQLKAILMVDNLDHKKCRLPDQLALQKSTQRYMSDLMPRVSPDYLMCHPWELLSSRRYLRHVGLNPDLAGEWGGYVMTLQKKYSAEEETIPWRDTPRDNGAQDEEVDQRGVETEEESMARRGELRPQMGFLNGVGIEDGHDPSSQQQSQRSGLQSEGHLNAAQQIFSRQYSKPTHHERSIARARARAHIRAPDQTASAIQLSVGRHGAAEIQGNLLQLPPQVTPTAENQEPQLPAPPQPECSISDDTPPDADRETRAASVPQARVQSPLPTNHSVRGRSVGLENNASIPAPSDVKQRGTERVVRRNLGGSWSYGSHGSEAELTPCPPARFREGMASAPAQSTPHSTLLSTEDSATQQHDSFTLPIRPSPRTVSVSGSSQTHAPQGNESKRFDQTTPKKRKMRVGMNGSPIPLGSSADKATLEVSDPPGFNGKHERRLFSSPTTSQTPIYRTSAPKGCEYPSPPTLRKNPRCVFGSPAFSHKAPEIEMKRRSLLQAFSQSRVDPSLGSSMTERIEAGTSPNQYDREYGVATGAFPSNLDPQLFDPPNPVAEQGENVSSSEPSPNHEVAQAHERSPVIGKARPADETQESILKQVETKLADGEHSPDQPVDAMDIDTEEPLQAQNSVLSQSAISSNADTTMEENTTLFDSGVSGTGDTTIEEEDTTPSNSRMTSVGDTTLEEGDTTLSDSMLTSLEDTPLEEGDNKAADPGEPSSKPKPSSNKKSKPAKAETKTRKVDDKNTSKLATQGAISTKETTKAPAKKKAKPKEAGARTQPRRVAKNGPEPTRELRPRTTKTK